MAALAREQVQQLPVLSRRDKVAIFNGSYLEEIPACLSEHGSRRVLLVVSKALDTKTPFIASLEERLGHQVVDKKVGVGAHSPYADVLDIAARMYAHDVDALVCVGSSSYSDASKIARLLHANLSKDQLNAETLESLVDQEKGVNRPGTLASTPKTCLILVPTSLSASEWNAVSSCSNDTGKKQHFGASEADRPGFGSSAGAADLILMDPELAVTAPERLWLSSGVRAIDHCVESFCHPSAKGNDELETYMTRGLDALIRGLRDYKHAKDVKSEANDDDAARQELLRGISCCQRGSRDAMMGILIWSVPLGPSHAIGHQLGPVAGVMHGVTSCVMLAPVLRHMLRRGNDWARKAQAVIVRIFNEALGWQEKEAGDAVERFVGMLGLPTRLGEVGVTSDEQVEKVADKTMTDVWGGAAPQINREEVMGVLSAVR